ncbi:MAG: protein kinase [Betaproteobacteria bacterium]|nr:protein kinase [Betaproteobacteria bacterium]
MSDSTDLQQLGKYSILGELGRGAMGVVYRGLDPFIKRELAIKVLRADLLDKNERGPILDRFRQEAQAAGRLNHPHIVAIYEYGEDGDQVFIAMELLRGRELKEYVQDGEYFDPADAIRIVLQLLDALGYAHANGVVHRDIKPANILVQPDNNIKVTDFGIARLESSSLTQAGTMLGTPSYMSPEQFMGQRVDGRSDLFSVGVMLYELLTGEKPFAGNSFATIMHKVLKEPITPPSNLNLLVTPELDAVILKALSKRPDDRFQDAKAFAEALTLAKAGRPMPAPAPASDLDATVVQGAAPARPARGQAPQAVEEATVVVAPAGAANDSTQVISPTAKTQVVTPAASATPASAAAGRKPLLLGGAILLALALGGGVVMLGKGGESSAPVAVEAKPAADAGWILINSTPPGAVVLVDGGRYGGVAPVRLEVPAGAHQIVLRKDGFHEIEASVEVPRGALIPFDAELVSSQ